MSRHGGDLRRLTAFSRDPAGGNPAGVWVGPSLPDPADMQRMAAEVGYSETAFVAPIGNRRYLVRYYSPEAEVSFCGHATIATGVVLGEGEGEGSFVLETAVGDVPVTASTHDGAVVASLTSVEPRQAEIPEGLLAGVLATFGWSEDDLDGAIPPKLAYAGAWHLVLALAERTTLDALSYDYDALKGLMLDAELTTVQVVWRESENCFHARDPFPVGGVVEDPATGAAAAALGGYLRDGGFMAVPARLTIRQGEVMGRPSRIDVTVPESGGITVSGNAVALDDPAVLPEALAHAFLARVWSAPADLDAIDELMTEDYVIHSGGTVIRGRAAFKEWVASFQHVLGEATNEVLDVFADAAGERVTTRWICRGLNRGIFGLPADGEPIEFTGIAVWRVEGGRLAECWVERSALEAVRRRTAPALA